MAQDQYGLQAAFMRKKDAAMALRMKRVTLEVFQRVVQRSPVDSGRFRGNWQVGIGTRPTSLTGRNDLAVKGSPPNADSMQQALIASSKINGKTVASFVVNNLPYAERLENGWSDQAPEGMVSITVGELRAMRAS